MATMSPSSSSCESFVTASPNYGLGDPATPPELERESGCTEPSVAEELEAHSADDIEGLDELAGIASAIFAFTNDLKCLGESDFVPRFTLDSHESQPSPQQPPHADSALPMPASLLARPSSASSECGNPEPALSTNPFQKWMKSLHRRANSRSRRLRGPQSDPPQGFLQDGDSYNLCPDRTRTKSSSGSSFAFVSAVKSASIGLASTSTRTKSRLGTMHSRDQSRTDQSSRLSIPVTRFSEDSAFDSELAPAANPAAIGRSLRRRKILEELITTEEDYIGDVRFLMNVSQSMRGSYALKRPALTRSQVYITTLASLPPVSAGLRSSINRNLAEIVELHEEILGEIHRVVPDSEYTQLAVPKPFKRAPRRPHHRWKSMDSVPENTEHISLLQCVPGMVAEPQVAEEVAKIFGKRVE